ncbi:MAG: NAD(P)-binding protein, partial [Pseudaminobacter sp.]|nr:NAD(P)-binding protein [Pseudaminobacter sp.]
MNAPEHIIVGSGINALVCAAMLSGRGRKVLV